ncbi:TetR/AcrR family transcriptional regulator [Halioxenophilus sp. WMMB6]|uniref:TetR/AcrR family transcriptional regulator n=1 Tax=Halioxenophilus sp. WMMB6 TaxID=3073815 RepID=UPI00295ED816|nr:TetR/AcrR family transcriptional regulator [Halioxenophilus sp. WMMB6]
MDLKIKHPGNMQQRSVLTREKLINAALDCVSELGYKGATMDAIVARAGVSRGAQVHHFPTKLGLISEAFELMLDAFVSDLRERVDAIRSNAGQPNELFHYLWEVYFSGQLFSVTMELVVHAKTTPELQSILNPITEKFHQNIDDCWYLLLRGRNIDDKKVVMILNLTLSLLRGMGFQSVLWNRPDYFQELLREWISIVEDYLK